VNKVLVTLEATDQSPVYNPALIIENWGDRKVQVTCNGKALKEGSGFRQGLVEKLEGTTLVIWIAKETNRPCTVEISARR
jgi:hypothetical protein